MAAVSLNQYIELIREHSLISVNEINKVVNDFCINIFKGPQGLSFLKQLVQKYYQNHIVDCETIFRLIQKELKKAIPLLLNNFYFYMMNFFEKHHNKLKDSLPVDAAMAVDNKSFAEYMLDNDIVCSRLCGIINQYIQLFSNNYHQLNYDGISDLKELADKNIIKGTEFYLNSKINIDLNYRDNLFVFINNELLLGSKNQIHAELIEQYMNEHDIIAESSIENNRVRSLDDVPELKRLDSTLALGHGVNSIAFIEYISPGVSIDNLVGQLKNHYLKIYDYSFAKNKVVCLAKKLKG